MVLYFRAAVKMRNSISREDVIGRGLEVDGKGRRRKKGRRTEGKGERERRLWKRKRETNVLIFFTSQFRKKWTSCLWKMRGRRRREREGGRRRRERRKSSMLEDK